MSVFQDNSHNRSINVDYETVLTNFTINHFYHEKFKFQTDIEKNLDK